MKRFNLPKILGKFLKRYNQNQVFMMKLRSSFYCIICDFRTHTAINLHKKQLGIDVDTCGVIARNTVNFSYYMIKSVIANLTRLSKLMLLFSENVNEKPLAMKNFKILFKTVKKCKKQYKNNIYMCYNYCKFFKLNAESQELEGFSDFFDQALLRMAKFIKVYKSFKVKKVVMTKKFISSKPFKPAIPRFLMD